jgi:hypothetical protein
MNENDLFEPNKKKDIAVICLSILMVWSASALNISRGMAETFFCLPILAVLLGIAYFITQKSGKWHILYLVLVAFFCLWILRIFIKIGIVQVLKIFLRSAQ